MTSTRTPIRHLTEVGTVAEHLAAAQAARAAGDRYWKRVTVPVRTSDGGTTNRIVVGVYYGTLTEVHGPLADITECECRRCALLEDPWDRAAQVDVITPDGLIARLHEVGWDHTTADRSF